ncbi:Holliday junction resolvase RuvX [Candidatus Sumerlaeota bacterium]|nr:Holliday junction resolvase RuvX [Candidatus Sumerlaeota bacterium]
MSEQSSLDSNPRRCLGIDYGRARIGLALSDSLGVSAQPLGVLERKNDLQAAEEIRALVQKHEVGRLVVGMPRNMDGSYGPQAQMTQDFMDLLEEQLSSLDDSVELTPWDERLTTMQAERVMIEAGVTRTGRKKKVDQVAATILLQNYLDFLHNQRASSE